MSGTYSVTDLASLQGIMSLKQGSSVAISVQSISSDESSQLEGQINRLVSECGCNLSAFALILAVAACGFFDAAYWPVVTSDIFKALAGNLAVCFVVAGIGKLVGRLRAKWKLARTVRYLEKRLLIQAV
jgi:hypothetical protein